MQKVANLLSTFPRYLLSTMSHQKCLTVVSTVDPSKITFSRSGPPLHPLDSPALHIADPATTSALNDAAERLLSGDCVAFPTETVYGLGADSTSDPAVTRIFSAKQRPLDNPLIVHVSSLSQLRTFLQGPIPPIYAPLIRAFWPGGLTILLPLPDHSPISKLVTAGQKTFAARLPDNPVARALCELSRPLAAPSANTSGRPSPTAAAHVLADLEGRVSLVLDGGACSVGLESTVVDGLSVPPRILRPGAITVEQIRQWEGWEDVVVCDGDVDKPAAPGMKYRHYSPTATVVLYEPGAKPPDESVLVKGVGVLRTRTWGNVGNGVEGVEVRDLGTGGEEISRRLFAKLRELDGCGVERILVEGVEGAHEGLAVMNRLRKAAGVIVVN